MVMILKNGYELIIERACPEDAAGIIEYLNIVGGESNNLLFGENGFIMTVEEEKAFIEKFNNSDKSLLLVGKIDNVIVSIVSLSGSVRERIAHRGEIAVSVKKAFWGLGIATLMINELIQFAKHTANMEILQLEVITDNERAIGLYEKLGFEKIGIYKKFIKIKEEYSDAYLMNLYF
jgi:RimJ/RimL family protein N-acetyltransferase